MTRVLSIAVYACLVSCTVDLETPPDSVLTCANSLQCPDGQICIEETLTCAPRTSSCLAEVDGVFVPGMDGTECLSDALADVGICINGVCRESVCGDGTLALTRGELCDDGLDNSDTLPDRCRTDCQPAGCGDGVLDFGEDCDDGNTVSGDGCSASCRICGNGTVDDGECCDEGMTAARMNPNDSCSSTCLCVGWRPAPDGAPYTGLGPTGGDALLEGFNSPSRVAADSLGNLFVSDSNGHRVIRVSTAGLLSVVAGNGVSGDFGDGGPAIAAQLFTPRGLAVDGGGNLYIADFNNHRVRRICVDGVGCVPGHIETIAGTGTMGFDGDGNAARAALLSFPRGVAVDGNGNVYVADTGNARIRKICADGLNCSVGEIETVAGSAMAGYSGDGDLATNAQLFSPSEVTVDNSGNIYIADTSNHRVRKVCADGVGCTVGFIDTVAGTGSPGFSGDDGPATAAALSAPRGVAVIADGTIYVTDSGNERIRRICGAASGCTPGTMSTIAGTGVAGFSGDGGPGTSAQLNQPQGGVVVGDRFAFADIANRRVRSLCIFGGTCTLHQVETLAGNGGEAAAGDGLPGTATPLGFPRGIAVDGDGDVLIADDDSHRVLRLCLSGVGCELNAVQVVGGTGQEGDSGDNGPATLATLSSPSDVALDSEGDILVADRGNHRIRKICLSGSSCVAGDIETVAGTGVMGDGGDGGPATSATFEQPRAVAVDSAGNWVVVDAGANRVRRVCVDGVGCAPGNIESFAGTGVEGFAGDNGLATAAELNSPDGAAFDPQGNLYVVDGDNHRVRKICGDGVGCTVGNIETVAGSASSGSGGDGGPATSAQLSSPSVIAVDDGGNLYIADRANVRVRKVCRDGVGCTLGDIDTVAGSTGGSFSGDGGGATMAVLGSVFGLATDMMGNLFIADSSNDRIRRLCGDSATCVPGNLETVAGAVDPNDGPLALASLGGPSALSWLTNASGLVADGSTGRVRRILLDEGRLETVAGYPGGFTSEGASARFSRELEDATGIASYSTSGTTYVLVSEQNGHVVRRITVPDLDGSSTWTIETWAGVLGDAGTSGSTRGTVRFTNPSGLVVDQAGGYVYIADSGNHVIRRLDLATDDVVVLAGALRTFGYAADDADPGDTVEFGGAPAPEALFRGPTALALGPSEDGTPNRNLYIADAGNNRIRRLALDSSFQPQNVTTVTGIGAGGTGGSGAPARFLPCDDPRGLTLDSFGNLFFSSRAALRRIDAGPDGVATGDDFADTVYGSLGAPTFPESSTQCLTAVSFDPRSAADDSLFVLDACQGFMVRLERFESPTP